MPSRFVGAVCVACSLTSCAAVTSSRVAQVWHETTGGTLETRSSEATEVRAALDDFAAAIGDELNTVVPKEWAQAVSRVYRLPDGRLRLKEPIARYRRVSSGLKLERRDDLLLISDETQACSVKLNGVHYGDVAQRVGGVIVVASVPSAPVPYGIVALDGGDLSRRWSARVKGFGASYPAWTGQNWHNAYCAIDVGSKHLTVFGIASDCLYVEVFRLSDGLEIDSFSYSLR